MLDHAAVVTIGGISLWTRSNTPQHPPTDELMHSFVAQGRQQGEADIGAYAVAWATHGQLIFLLASPRLITLPPYVPTLLLAFVRTFTSSFSSIINVFTSAKVDVLSVDPMYLRKTIFAPSSLSNMFQGWDERFDELLRSAQLQHKKSTSSLPSTTPPITVSRSQNDDNSNSISNEEDSSLKDGSNAKTHTKSLQVQKAGRKGNKKGANNTNNNTAGGEPAKKKKGRKWGHDGLPLDIDAADSQLDYSNPSSEPETMSSSGRMDVDESPLVAANSIGHRDAKGTYDVASFADGDDEDDNDQSEESTSHLTKLFSSLGFTSRTLSKAEIAPAVSSMRDHLAKKNVARTVCDELVEPLSTSLAGKKVSGPRALENAMKDSMAQTLTNILTPATSTDILQDIKRKLRSTNSAGSRQPYVFAFCGVNGVGKSTNLAKVAFWLLNNKYRILIAACDTFRSGAVEQLNTHVRNLSKLDFSFGDQEKRPTIEIFQKGYGKDAAGIASSAISHASENEFDIVLIDTAGRMQDNEPLMKALSKLVTQNKPDKVLFVAEALVGNQGLDQLVSFDSSLKQLSQSKDGSRHGIDGIILTKFDTIDDKVGAAVSMTYATGIPILFIGTGQTYSDLRSLKVDSIVRALMRD